MSNPQLPGWMTDFSTSPSASTSTAASAATTAPSTGGQAAISLDDLADSIQNSPGQQGGGKTVGGSHKTSKRTTRKARSVLKKIKRLCKQYRRLTHKNPPL